MEELWPGQAVISHLTLTVTLAQATQFLFTTHRLSHEGEYLCPVILNSCN